MVKLLTADEVAEILRVSTYRVYDLVRRQLIPAIKLGERQIRFEEIKLREWIERGGNNCLT